MCAVRISCVGWPTAPHNRRGTQLRFPIIVLEKSLDSPIPFLQGWTIFGSAISDE